MKASNKRGKYVLLAIVSIVSTLHVFNINFHLNILTYPWSGWFGVSSLNNSDNITYYISTIFMFALG